MIRPIMCEWKYWMDYIMANILNVLDEIQWTWVRKLEMLVVFNSYFLCVTLKIFLKC